MKFHSVVLLGFLNYVNGQCDKSQCIHTTEYAPVCGSDGVTYYNEAVLDCANFCGDSPTVTVEGKGGCEGRGIESTADDCDASDCFYVALYDPVCGSDGRDYMSQAALSCANWCSKPDAAVSLAYFGECRSDIIEVEEEKEDCDRSECMHTLEYEPVCGSDGVTYSNTGVLACANYCETVVTSQYDGPCRAEGLESLSDTLCDESECIYMQSDDPVCGSNGKTFPNEGALSCANYCNAPDSVISLVYFGECRSDDLSGETENCDKEGCFHTEEYDPVCGSNGVTYTNEGVLDCANYCEETPIVTLEYEGKCKAGGLGITADTACKESDCMYTQEFDPVCGSDGLTYSNEGELACANYCTDPASAIMAVYHGACREPTIGSGSACDPAECFHTLEVDYVCGSNGVTYMNSGVLDCANYCITDQSQQITITGQGKCKPAPDDGEMTIGIAVCDPTECVHSAEVSPVCGSDENTYSNQGVLSCANYCLDAEDHILLQYHGVCNKTAVAADCDPTDCVHTAEVDYVCGSNGITYQNQGALACSNTCRDEEDVVFIASKGKCKEESSDEIGITICDPSECLHTTEFSPVCGSNDVSYYNEGVLYCSNFCRKPDDVVSVAYQGECRSPVFGIGSDCSPDDCVHTEEFAQVCGSDGVTYDNESILSCQNYCRDPGSSLITVDYIGACKGISDVDASDPFNSDVCPNTRPPIGEACDENIDCLYTPVTCPGYPNDEIFGYGEACSCIVDKTGASTYQCAAALIICPDAPTDAPALSNADPSNAGQCPVDEPNPVAQTTCDPDSLTTDCLYNPFFCEGYEDFVGYISRCTCFEDGILRCAQAAVACPDPNAIKECPLEKPANNDECGLSPLDPSCRYNAYSCPDSNQIFFQDVCTCSSGQFICVAEARQQNNCHNDVENPQCPILSPAGQNEECSIPSDVVCGYEPDGCPGDDDDGVFMTTCQCIEGQFQCLSRLPLNCDGTSGGSEEENGGGGGFLDICFPGDAVVDVQDIGLVKMEQLKIGDMVRVADGSFEPVYSFGHKNQSHKADYLQLNTQDSTLRLTASHMVYERNRGFIAAETVKVGDELRGVTDDMMTTVTSIEIVNAKGMYAPFTPSGTLIVNNVVASSFVYLSQLPQVMNSVLSSQWIAHTGELPHRLACHYLDGDCADESYEEMTGINYKWCAIPLRLMSVLSSQNATVQFLMAVIITILLAIFWTLEQTLLVHNSPVTAMILLALTMLAFSRTKTNRIKQ